MVYRFATERQDYTDLASGRVLHALPGYPALPVRLADEVFQRCLALRDSSGSAERIVLYDPCCGGAYHLSVLGLLHTDVLQQVVGSDIDTTVLGIARQNLDLLSPAGLVLRAREIEQRAAHFGKDSHRGALDSAQRLREQLSRNLNGRQLEKEVFVADALRGSEIRQHLGANQVDVVVTDVPYGWRSQWQSSLSVDHVPDPMWALLEAMGSVLKQGGIVGVVSDKQQKAHHDSYQRVAHFRVGKRRVGIFKCTK